MNAMERPMNEAWIKYREQELTGARPVLEALGYQLDDTQVHIGGERFLMAGNRDVGGGGRKLVLTGARTSDTMRVVIKVSSDPAGQQEIMREREARERINAIEFAYHTFATPQELHFGNVGPYLIAIIEYVEQDVPLLDRRLDEQFFLTLKALEAQEGTHATTERHARIIKQHFGMSDVNTWLREFKQFATTTLAIEKDNEHLALVLERAERFLTEHKIILERYSGFLTHADFVPNNFRVRGHEIYLLDYASIHFGNKYESWARFLNFMVHHNPQLERALVQYIRENRGEEEYLALRLMRVYKLGFLLKYYAEALGKTEGATHELTRARLNFWTVVMECILNDVVVPNSVVEEYLEKQQSLRSEDEKARQREMIGRA